MIRIDPDWAVSPVGPAIVAAKSLTPRINGTFANSNSGSGPTGTWATMTFDWPMRYRRTESVGGRPLGRMPFTVTVATSVYSPAGASSVGGFGSLVPRATTGTAAPSTPLENVSPRAVVAVAMTRLLISRTSAP